MVRGGKQLVSLGNAADPEKLLNEMNAICNPEVNVYFELGRTDAATIDGLSPQADAIEMQKLPKGFLHERDSGSALTFFLVRKVTDRGTADNGATNAKERVSLIADSRSDSTWLMKRDISSELSLPKANTIPNTVIRRRVRRC